MRQKSAYLTIDDSPSLHMKDRVDFLNAHGIRAIWFCRGDYLSERPEWAIHALQSGHIIGNHSWSHPRFSELTIGQATLEIDRTDALLDDIHRRAGIDRRLKLFRFPYEDRIGSDEHHASLQRFLKSRGFVLPRFEGVRSPRFLRHLVEEDSSIFWTYDSEDWTLRDPNAPDAEERMASVLSRMDRNDPAAGCGLTTPGTEVVVLHDHSHTGGQWQTVVQALLDHGIVFQTV